MLFVGFGVVKCYAANIGMWLSLVEHYVRDVGAAGSNPVIPTTGCSAGGSALDWGSRCRRFKSCHSDHY